MHTWHYTLRMSPQSWAGKVSKQALSSPVQITSFSYGEKNIIQPSPSLLTSVPFPLPSEPTNMLDVRAILWLESYLQVWGGEKTLIQRKGEGGTCPHLPGDGANPRALV